MPRQAANLAILGSFPPPFGGVATHLMRLVPLLESEHVSFVIYNLVSDSECPPHVHTVRRHRTLWLLKFVLTCRERAIFVLSDRLPAWCLVACASILRGRRFGIRLRNSQLVDWCAESRFKALLAGAVLRAADVVVCVNEELANASEGLGVAQSNLVVAPGFLPPEPGASDWSPNLAHLRDFMADHSPIVAASGKVNWYNGVDLYGLDMLVRLAESLVPIYPRIGIVICFWDHTNVDGSYLEQLIERANSAGVGSHILFSTTPGKFLPVLSRCQVFVRPTCTDGDANSLREALHLGVRAIASDCVARPVGTVVFANRDQNAFEEAVHAALNQTNAREAGGGTGADPIATPAIRSYIAALARLAGGASGRQQTSNQNSVVMKE